MEASKRSTEEGHRFCFWVYALPWAERLGACRRWCLPSIETAQQYRQRRLKRSGRCSDWEASAAELICRNMACSMCIVWCRSDNTLLACRHRHASGVSAVAYDPAIRLTRRCEPAVCPLCACLKLGVLCGRRTGIGFERTSEFPPNADVLGERRGTGER